MTTAVAEKTTYTQAELLAEAKARFGDDPLDFAFQCPSCGDIATIREFKDAGDAQMAGQGCIGRLLGALAGPRAKGSGKRTAKRGCDWCAFGFIPGPWEITFPDGHTARAFPLAPAPPKTPVSKPGQKPGTGEGQGKGGRTDPGGPVQPANPKGKP